MQNICITFVQCWSNVEDVGPTLYTYFVCTGVFSLYVVLRIKLGVIVMGINQSDYIDLGDVSLKNPTDLKTKEMELSAYRSCVLLLDRDSKNLSRSSYKNIPEHTRHPPNVAVMLGQRRRRWTNITAISGQSIVFAF